MYRDRVRHSTKAALAATRARRERTSRFAPYGFTLTDDDRLEEDSAEKDALLLICECRAAGFSWEGTARELARIGLLTRSGRPWTMWNVLFCRNVIQRVREQQTKCEDVLLEIPVADARRRLVEGEAERPPTLGVYSRRSRGTEPDPCLFRPGSLGGTVSGRSDQNCRAKKARVCHHVFCIPTLSKMRPI